METLISVINSQEPLVAQTSEFGGSGTAPGAGFNENAGSAYAGKVGRTTYTNGRGIKSFNGQTVYYINNQPVIIHSLHQEQYARVSIINNDLTLSESYLARIEDIIDTGSNLHDAYKEVYLKSVKEKDEDERIQTFIELYPDPESEILGLDFMKWHNVLTDACKSGQLRFIESQNLDVNKKYSIKFLVKLTRRAYNPAVMQKIITKYGI